MNKQDRNLLAMATAGWRRETDPVKRDRLQAIHAHCVGKKLGPVPYREDAIEALQSFRLPIRGMSDYIRMNQSSRIDSTIEKLMKPKIQVGQRVAIKSGLLAWVLEAPTDWRFVMGRWVQYKKNSQFIAVAVDRGGGYLSPGIVLVDDVVPWDEYERDRAARLERERVKRERELDLERRFEALALGEGAVLVGGMVRLPLDRLETLLKKH